MKKMLAVVFAATAAALLSGCGTVCNLAGGITHPDDEPRVYGGVAKDYEFLDRLAGNDPPTLGKIEDGRALLFLLPLAVAEPVLSLIADTLTLPITIPLQARRIAASTPERQGQQGDSAVAAPNPLASWPP